jgi:hypothetical protein
MVPAAPLAEPRDAVSWPVAQYVGAAGSELDSEAGTEDDVGDEVAGLVDEVEEGDAVAGTEVDVGGDPVKVWWVEVHAAKTSAAPKPNPTAMRFMLAS